MFRTALSSVLFLTFAANLPGCAASPDEPEGTEVATGDAEELGKQMQAVQFNAGGHFQIDMTNQSQVEGFLMYRARNGAYWVLCGVTFVSRHFGITAGHCVSQLRRDSDDTFDPGDDAIIVAQLDARNIINANGGVVGALTKLSAQATVSGTWPAWTRSSGLSCSDGLCLSMADTQCRLRFRCGGQQPPEVPFNENCPPAIGGHDIAMLHCPNRTGMPFATVAGDNVAGQPIDIHWNHELLHMPSSEGQGTQEQQDHYMRYDGSLDWRFGKLSNYHYVGGAQYFPFVSSSFPNGEHYRVTDTSVAAQGTISTNAYGCHGTSGSGAFLANTTQLIGPVIGGGTSGFLCMDTVAHVPRDPSGNTLNWLTNAAPWVTRQLEALVVWDR